MSEIPFACVIDADSIDRPGFCADLRRLSDASREQLWSRIQPVGDNAPEPSRTETKPSGKKGMGGGKKKVANSTRDGGFHPTIAVVGDFMTDVYHIGEATSLSAEVPIPIVKIKETKRFAGGAGNVAQNLSRLGCNVHYFAQSYGTPIKNRLMVGDTQLARWDENDRCDPVLGLNNLNEVDAIVVADYGKGAIDLEAQAQIKQRTRIPIFVDTKRDPSVWSGVATAVFPNGAEYGRFNKEYLDFKGLIVNKLGSGGLNLFKNDFSGLDIVSPAKARFVRSVNGAGDSVLAAFVYKYLDLIRHRPDFNNQDWQNILDFANAAAAIAVENPFTYAPTLDEVNERYYEL